MRWTTIFFTFFFGISLLTADSSAFENDFNHSSGKPIDAMRLVGERCSGTSYIYGLLKKNFSGIHTTAANKHFLPWFDLSAFHISKKIGNPEDQEVLGWLTESTLLILVVRDPYDWLRSFYANPWHVSKSEMLHKGLIHFMKHEWVPSDEEFALVEPDHWNPYDQRRFKNVLELRKYKTLNYLQVGFFAENFLVIQYEAAVKNPKGFIQFVSDYCHAKRADTFENVLAYKNSKKDKKTFKGSHYEPLTVKELGFINCNLDWGTEKLIGYELVRSIKQLEER